MKNFNLISKAQLALYSLFLSVLTFAQDTSPDLDVDVDIDKPGSMDGDWMSNPLVWVIGALVFILIIALVARGGRSRE
ncbi:MAG: hypothetical protein ITF99_09405 [Chryseobacterium sp.]|nr:hypothetical protein [Chryseobacterium sp.]